MSEKIGKQNNNKNSGEKLAYVQGWGEHLEG